MAMTNFNKNFRFLPDGHYSARPAIPRTPRRGKTINERKSKICPACGIQRSAMNKCECNS